MFLKTTELYFTNLILMYGINFDFLSILERAKRYVIYMIWYDQIWLEIIGLATKNSFYDTDCPTWDAMNLSDKINHRFLSRYIKDVVVAEGPGRCQQLPATAVECTVYPRPVWEWERERGRERERERETRADLYDKLRVTLRAKGW